MTLLAMGVTVCLTLALGAFTADLTVAAGHRARAQTAADAAALAAVAESSLFGRNLQRETARTYAAANGARLIRCRCEPGSVTVEVEVAVEGYAADASATIEIDRMGVLPQTNGLHPMLAGSVARLTAVSGGAVWIVSGFRTTAHQAELWRAAVALHGSPEAADDWVAPPGHSMHERGLAVDLGGDLALAAQLVRRLGLPLHRPLAHEPWHFELSGSRL